MSGGRATTSVQRLKVCLAALVAVALLISQLHVVRATANNDADHLRTNEAGGGRRLRVSDPGGSPRETETETETEREREREQTTPEHARDDETDVAADVRETTEEENEAAAGADGSDADGYESDVDADVDAPEESASEAARKASTPTRAAAQRQHPHARATRPTATPAAAARRKKEEAASHPSWTYHDASSGVLWIDAWGGTSVDAVTVFQASDRADVTRSVSVKRASGQKVSAVVVYNLTSMTVRDTARVEVVGPPIDAPGGSGSERTPGIPTVLEVVEGESMPPPEAVGGGDEAMRAAKTLLEAARARERLARDDIKLMERTWDAMISGAVSGRSDGGVRPYEGKPHAGIALELDALAASGFDSLRALMARRREEMTKLEDEARQARAAVVAAQEALQAATAAASGRRWPPSGINDVHPNERAPSRAKAAAFLHRDGRRQVRMSLEGAAPVYTLKLSYLVRGAHWSPSYDCRAVTGGGNSGTGVNADDETGESEGVTSAGAGEPSVVLTYFGDVIQNTGEDWTRAKVSLSTAMPAVAGDPPEVRAPTLGFVEEHHYATNHAALSSAGSMGRGTPRRERMMRYKQAHPMMAMAATEGQEMADAVPEPEMTVAMDADGAERAFEDGGVDDGTMDATSSSPSFPESFTPKPPHMLSVSVSSGATSTLFGVRRPASILSDGQPHKLVIGAVDITPTFAYKVAPRASAAAFLTAAGTNDSPYPLLPGPVRVFLDGSFTTTSRLPLVAPGDNLSLGLGVDPGIVVTVDPVRTREENRGSSLLGTESRRRAVTARCIVRNAKKVAVDLEVTDVFPRSEHKELRVSLVEKTAMQGEGDDAVRVTPLEDAAQGKVTWKVHLPPGSEQALVATHRIEWPKGKEYFQKEAMR